MSVKCGSFKVKMTIIMYQRKKIDDEVDIN